MSYELKSYYGVSFILKISFSINNNLYILFYISLIINFGKQK